MRRTGHDKVNPPAAALAKQEICVIGEDVPPGWIIVDDFWDPTRCNGNPNDPTAYNVAVIVKYADLPIHATLEVCAGAPLPEGWDEVARFHDPSRCGHPTNTSLKNIKRIERVE